MFQLAPASQLRGHRRRQAIAAVLLMCLGLTGAVVAIENMQLVVERMDGAGWSASGIAIEVDLVRDRPGARARIDRFKMGEQVVRNVRADCDALELTPAIIACTRARVSLQAPGIGEQIVSGRITYARRTGDVDLDVAVAQLAGGAGRIRASLRKTGWKTHAKIESLQIAQLLGIAREFKVPLPEVSGSGRISVDVTASGGARLQHVKLASRFAEVTANNAAGTLASDQLSFNAHLDLERASEQRWRVEAHVDSDHGQAYAEPVFLDFGVHALSLRMAGEIEGAQSLRLDRFAVTHRDVIAATGSARIDLRETQPLRELDARVERLQFPGAYESYLQPFLLNTDFKALKTSGALAATLRVANGAPQSVDLDLNGVEIDGGANVLVLQGLEGGVRWRDAPDEDEDIVLRATAERSTLKWRGGSVLNLALGASELQFAALGKQFRLLTPAHIPVLDGALDLESLRIRNVGSPTVAFMIDATIQPISVEHLCRAFGWPEFGGKVAGSIAKLRLREGVVTLGTTLQAEVFDGRVAVKDLRLEDALGQWPRFYSSIALENLDLELVTRAFSFGRITGRLSGRINELQLFNWQPIAFDAKLYTPPGDRTPHRISQRAVENIGSIGGGGAGITQALSSGFLRFFDEFRYKRLGLSCRLVNEVCYMEGVSPAPNGGYYLVEGSGLPRIDVIGGARRVDWPRLVKQLIAVTESGGPVVQ